MIRCNQVSKIMAAALVDAAWLGSPDNKHKDQCRRLQRSLITLRLVLSSAPPRRTVSIESTGQIPFVMNLIASIRRMCVEKRIWRRDRAGKPAVEFQRILGWAKPGRLLRTGTHQRPQNHALLEKCRSASLISISPTIVVADGAINGCEITGPADCAAGRLLGRCTAA